jgi:DNA-binding NarL/FixJ family response regulator
VHRVQLLQVEGEWDLAEEEASRVCTELADMNVGAVAEGHYQIGEIRRLRGDREGAEEAYKRAHEYGRDPQPGLALLRLAQGRIDVASASVRAASAARPGDRLTRARLCAAQVEIALAAGDPGAAWQASAELDQIAAGYGSSGFAASAQQARGAVLLAKGRAADALPVLHEACRSWQILDATYDAARARVLIAQACAVLGDDDGAALELDAAAATFERLGAVVDAMHVAELRDRAMLPGGLTAREAQVLGLVAEGMTNKEAASALTISEKTVARHLANIFTKLGLSSRTAAAAYAIEHGLAPRRR